MRQSSWYLGIPLGIAALAVALALAAGGYFAGRTVMASRLEDRFATVGGFTEARIATAPADAAPASATACGRLRRAERIDEKARLIPRLPDASEANDRIPAI